MSTFYVRKAIENFEKLKEDKLVDKYEKKHIKFTYYTEKFLNKKRKEQEEEIKIVGNVCLSELKKKKNKNKDKKEKDNDVFLLLDETCEYDEELKYRVTDKTNNGNTVGYFEVGENEYIRISKKSKLPLILILILMGIILGFLIQSSSPEPVNPNTDGVDSNGVVSNGAISEAGYGQIEIAGYSSLSVSGDAPTIQLVNPQSNDVYFKYIIKPAGGDDLIFESKLIEPGKAYLWDAKSALDVGTHALDFYIQTFDIKTKANCEGACNRNVEVVVK